MLDVDEAIMERNLRLVGDGDADADSPESFLMPNNSRIAPTNSATALLPDDPSALPSVEVTPDPGLCVKTRSLGGSKVFLNLCLVAEIPPAPPMSEQGLADIVEREDYASDYRVPMSLGAPRREADKSGAECLACDVAVNAAWFRDCVEGSDIFTAFVVQVAMEGLRDKYGDQVNLDRQVCSNKKIIHILYDIFFHTFVCRQNWTVLKNKKYLGRPQRHRIQKRAKGTKIVEMGEQQSNVTEEDTRRPLIQGTDKCTYYLHTANNVVIDVLYI